MKADTSPVIAAFIAIATLGLAGCGSSNSSSSAPPPPPAATAEGIWVGANSGGSALVGAVLENGQYWLLSHADQVINGIVQGSGTSLNGSFTSTNGIELRIGVPNTPVNISASYRERESLNGTITPQSGGTVATFTAAYDTSYETAATLAAISGDWSGKQPAGETFALNISSAGGLVGTSSLGCLFTGTVAPRSADNNVFNLTITFGGGVCRPGTQTMTGIALIQGSGASAVLFAAVLNADRSNAVGFYSTR